MARLARKLRVCKWLGTVGCVLILAVFVWSGWGDFYLDWTPGMTASRDDFSVVDYPDVNAYRLFVFGGYLEIRRVGTSNPNYANYWSVSHHSPWLVLHRGAFPQTAEWYPEFSSYGVLLPLWLPFLVLLLPTLLLWRRDLRKPRSGCCRRCDYDLTGNTSGVCPECGGKIPA